jgi:hypothetical protein
MRFIIVVCAALLCLGTAAVAARADVGWSEEQYTQAYGPGERGFAKVNERGYARGGNHLVVEFSADNMHSLGELWALGTVRDDLPPNVTKAGEAAEKGPLVDTVTFKAKSALSAEIHEATVNGEVVRVDIRNGLVTRIAFCGPPPTCSLWRRIFGPSCETKVTCGVLERALSVDRTMDDLHVRAERAMEQIQHNQ